MYTCIPVMWGKAILEGKVRPLKNETYKTALYETLLDIFERICIMSLNCQRPLSYPPPFIPSSTRVVSFEYHLRFWFNDYCRTITYESGLWDSLWNKQIPDFLYLFVQQQSISHIGDLIFHLILIVFWLYLLSTQSSWKFKSKSDL